MNYFYSLAEKKKKKENQLHNIRISEMTKRLTKTAAQHGYELPEWKKEGKQGKCLLPRAACTTAFQVQRYAFLKITLQ